MTADITNLPPRDPVFADGRRCCDDCRRAFLHDMDRPKPHGNKDAFLRGLMICADTQYHLKQWERRKTALRNERDSPAQAQMMVRAGPILHDELWATIAERDAFLCFDCTEQRLGRPLTQADLIPCPFNAGWISFDGADVAAMQFVRGRRLLPERPS